MHGAKESEATNLCTIFCLLRMLLACSFRGNMNFDATNDLILCAGKKFNQLAQAGIACLANRLPLLLNCDFYHGVILKGDGLNISCSSFFSTFSPSVEEESLGSIEGGFEAKL